MKPSAVLFDCDGVIVDSEGIGFGLLAEEFRRFGHPMTLDDMQNRFVGGTIAGLWAEARAIGIPLPNDWVDEFYGRLYARLAEGTALVAGIETVLDQLDAAGIPYAVGSNGSDRKMQVTLGQHPTVLRRLSGRLFSGQTLGKPKPDPALYLYAATALKADPAECVVVEDSPTGARAARAAGMRCLGYAPEGDGARLIAEGATTFRSMADLPALLGI